MTRSILALAVTVLVGCGVDDGAPLGDDVNLLPPAGFDALRPPPSHTAIIDEAQPYLVANAAPLPLSEHQQLQPGDSQVRQLPSCATALLSPTVSATLRQIPGLGIFEPAPVGSSVQASYFNTTGVNEEFRVGIAEFDVGPNVVTSATLRFSERRAVITAPTTDDTFALTVYPADLTLTLDDWKIAGEDAPRFVTNANNAPEPLVEIELTKFVQTAGKRVGVRFAMDSKQISGHGTGFDDLKLEVTACNPGVR